ncbi:hypothetical protein [Anaerosporobacter sp.]
MKHINLSIVFVLIMVAAFLILNQKTDTVTAITKLQMQYNNAVDNAVSDSFLKIVDQDSIESTSIDFATVTDSFFRYLAWNLGLEAESLKAKALPNYVPVIAYIVQDGVYLAYHKIEGENPQVVKQTDNMNALEWNTSIEISKRIPFEKITDTYQIQYTLTDYIRVINIDTKEEWEGYYVDLFEQFPGLLPSTQEKFDKERRLIIINCITDSMNTYIESHNAIANHYGIKYHISLPYIENDEWYRTIDDISMLVLFQGYPYGNDTLGYYNRLALGGARIRKVE